MITRAPGRPPAPPAPAPPRVDGHPRIRARRAEVARSAGRRRLRYLNVVLALVGVAVWTLVALRSPLFDVDRVQVSGVRQASDEQVRSAAGVVPGEAMADVDLGAARRRVAALPWVRTATVRRMWPGTVRVVVVERRPLAVVEGRGAWSRVDAEGRVIDVSRHRPAGLLELVGARPAPPGSRLAHRDRAALSTLGRLPAALVGDAVATRLDGADLVLELTDGFEVVIGDSTDLRDKAEAAAAVRRAAERSRGCRIDVRVATAPFLTQASTCA